MTEARRHPMSWEIKEKGKLLNLFVSILICALFFALNSNESNSCNHFFPIESREKSAILEKRRGKKKHSIIIQCWKWKNCQVTLLLPHSIRVVHFFSFWKGLLTIVFLFSPTFSIGSSEAFVYFQYQFIFMIFFPLFYTFRRYTVCFKARH